MPDVIAPSDVGVAWSDLGSAISWDALAAGEDVAVAGALVGDGVGAGVAIIAGAAAADPVVDIGAIVIGVALLVVAFAIGILLLRPLGWLLGHIPFIGGAIEGALDNASDAVVGFVLGLVWDGLRAIWWCIRALFALVLGLPMDVGKALRALAGFVRNLSDNYIPWVYTEATQYAGQIYNAVEGDLANGINMAEQYTYNVWNAVETDLRNTYTAVENDIGWAYTQATNYAGSLYSAVEGDLANGVRAAEGYAEALHADAVGVAESLFSGAEADIASLGITGAAALASATAMLTDLVTGTSTALDQKLSNEIGNVAQTLTQAEQATSKKLQDYLDNCGNNLCDNLSGLANDFSGLLRIADDVALAGLLGDILRDPEGVANELRAFIPGIVSDAVGAARAA